jgi:hypothetical protein
MPSGVLTPVDDSDNDASVPSGPLIHAMSSNLLATEGIGVGVGADLVLVP